jgi:hypothetical protein
MIAIPSGALITVVRPRIPSRFVQFSLPLQRGQYTWNPEVCPVRVVGPLGEIPAQAERITRHPDGSTALIMVYADAGEGNAPSVVDIYWDPHREDAEDRPWSQDFQYHAAVLEARESFPFHKAKPTMDGPVVVQRRLREFQAGVTFEGVATFFHDCPAVRIEGLFHNALPGAKEQYLSTIGLDTWLPPGWKVQWVVEEPIGNDQGAIGDNQPHFVGQRSIRLITAVIAPADYLGWSVAHPTHGLATTPAEWRRLPAWAPLFIPAADVSFMATKVDHDLLVKFSGIEYALRRGSNYPPYTKPDGTWSYPQAVRHGFFHPCYAQEGGETSGYGITYGAPCDLIETGSPTGFMFAMYMLRMRCDRDRVGHVRAVRSRHQRQANPLQCGRPGSIRQVGIDRPRRLLQLEQADSGPGQRGTDGLARIRSHGLGTPNPDVVLGFPAPAADEQLDRPVPDSHGRGTGQDVLGERQPCRVGRIVRRSGYRPVPGQDPWLAATRDLARLLRGIFGPSNAVQAASDPGYGYLLAGDGEREDPLRPTGRKAGFGRAVQQPASGVRVDPGRAAYGRLLGCLPVSQYVELARASGARID